MADVNCVALHKNAQSGIKRVAKHGCVHKRWSSNHVHGLVASEDPYLLATSEEKGTMEELDRRI